MYCKYAFISSWENNNSTKYIYMVLPPKLRLRYDGGVTKDRKVYKYTCNIYIYTHK